MKILVVVYIGGIIHGLEPTIVILIIITIATTIIIPTIIIGGIHIITGIIMIIPITTHIHIPKKPKGIEVFSDHPMILW
jgi:hypothetical protein